MPGARDRARAGKLAFGTVDTWLIWKLTGGAVHVTDTSNASRTMLFDIHTLRWDEELLRLFDVPAGILPEVRPSSAIYGDVAARVGLGSLPIAGVAGDQQAALFGQMCRTPGMSKNTYGTGCFLLQNIGTKPTLSRHQLVTTVAWTIGDRTEYAIEGSVFIGGAVVQWIRDGLGLIRQAADIEPLAASVPDNGGVYLVPAFAGLGAPHWDSFARGTIVGITRGTTAGHLARAALESIALQVADLLDAMRADSGIAHPGTARGRRRRRRRPPDADSGRSHRRPGRAADGHGDHGAWRRLPRRPGRRLLEIHRRDQRPVENRSALRARNAGGSRGGDTHALE